MTKWDKEWGKGAVPISLEKTVWHFAQWPSVLGPMNLGLDPILPFSKCMSRGMFVNLSFIIYKMNTKIETS